MNAKQGRRIGRNAPGAKWLAGMVVGLLLPLIMSACGEGSPAASTVGAGVTSPAAAATTAAANTAPAATTAAAIATVATTVAATIAVASTIASTPTAVATGTAGVTVSSFQAALQLTVQAETAAISRFGTPTPANTPTLEPGVPTFPPTLTVGPTPQPAPVGAAWVKDGVCYEVFVRSFFDSNGDGKGDLAGLTAHLDYLNDGQPDSKSLGINCIWLMPVTASPSYHAYDTTDYYRVNPDYGTNEDYKKLVQEAHKRGIYIINDLVLNHTSDQHEWFKQAAADPKSPYRDWYIFTPNDPGYLGPWGDKAWHKNPAGEGYYYGVFGADLPDLNLRNPAVTKQLYDVARFWLQDMGADGFRIDAAKHLIEDGKVQADTPETKAWLRDFHRYYSSIKPDAFTIGEVNTPGVLTGYYPDQLDEYFEFNLANSLVRSAGSGQADFVSQASSSFNAWPLQRFGTFLTNHDQQRVMTALGGDMARMKLAAAAYLTLPGLPFIYYGEEIGMVGGKPDEQIRTPMQWSAGPQGGFTTGQPWEKLNPDTATVNVQAENADPNSLLNFYRQLVRLRRSHPALAQGGFVPAQTSEPKVAAYLRQSGPEAVLVVINMGDTPVSSLKIGLEKSGLAAGKYSAASLFTLNGAGGNPAPLQVGPDGLIADYAPLAALPGQSAWVIQLKGS